MTYKQALREAAEKATKGKWEVFAKPTPTYFDAIHSLAALLNGTVGEQKTLYMIDANGICPALTGTGPNSANNAEFIAAANPATVLVLLDELEVISKSEWKLAGDLTEAQMNNTVLEKKLEAAEKRIAELQSSHSKLRDTLATIHNTIRLDGSYTPLAAILNAAKRAYEESATAAGIGKGEA